MKTLGGTFNQERGPGAISVIVKTDGSFAALVKTHLCWMYHDLFPGCTPAVTVTSDTSDGAVSCHDSATVSTTATAPLLIKL